MSGGARHGAVLIIVVGLSVALLGLAMTFLVRMRADANVAQGLIEQVQARSMLLAACTYVQECSRIGFGQEAFGWRDIRDGSDPGALPGPRDFAGEPLYAVGSGRWPDVGGAARCPMGIPVLPPWATKGRFAYNPVARRWPNADPDRSGGEVRYNALAPQPAQFPDEEPDDPWRYQTLFGSDGDDGREDGSSGHAGAWRAFAQGSRLVDDDPGSLRLRNGSAEAWFRVYRDTVDQFIVTVGTGSTRGFRDWSEVVAAGEQNLFLGSDQVFREASTSERRQWYRIEWSPSVGGRTLVYPHQRNLGLHSTEDMQQKPLPTGYEMTVPNFDAGKGTGTTIFSGTDSGESTYETNHMGSISFIQRLNQEPLEW